jgi:histidyl-tRNA synthetase
MKPATAARRMVQRPRGTRDFGPLESRRRRLLEQVLDDEAVRAGFDRVQTPLFESLDLFTAKSGPGVIGQLYAFEDKGGRPLTLRPELTAPVMRMIAEEMRAEAKPLRLAYHGACFRYEEFKTGRYREFYQYGIEVVGASGPLVDAEVIALAVRMLHATGLKGWTLRIGHVGVLRDVLAGLGLSDVAPEGGEAPISSAMRLLDKGDVNSLQALFAAQGLDAAGLDLLHALGEASGGREALASARPLLKAHDLSLLALDALVETVEALDLLAPAPPALEVDLRVARGLDYYTGMVFEVHVPELGGEGQVLGGGTYNLLHLFGLEDLDPSCGFGLGFDRVLLALEHQAAAEGRTEVLPGESGPSLRLAVVPFRVPAASVLTLVAAVRNAGVVVDLELRGRAIGKSFAWADGLCASHVLVVGPRDLEAGTGNLKRLSDGSQVDVALTASDVLAALNN